MAASKETLQDLHRELAEEFLNVLRSGKAKAADLNAARQFLRDNNSQDTSESAKVWHLKDAVTKVPFPTEDEVAEEAM